METGLKRIGIASITGIKEMSVTEKVFWNLTDLAW